MAQVDERLSAQFLAWERRGRGWDVFPHPVSPEPPYRPFSGHGLPRSENFDDGRRPTKLSAWTQSLSRKLTGTNSSEDKSPPTAEEPEPVSLARDVLVELPIFLPADFNPRRDTFEQFLTSLTYCNEPFTFEVQGTGEAIAIRLVVHPLDAPAVMQQLETFFPEMSCVAREGQLAEAWIDTDSGAPAIIEFGLSEPFMRPLAMTKVEPFVGLVGALSKLQPGEIGIYQVIFQPVQNPWADSVVRSVTDGHGGAFFVNAPELVGEARSKTARPLFAVVVRIATQSAEFDRTWDLATNIASALRVFAHPNANELVPLGNKHYPVDAHVDDLLRRQTRRPGMLLNFDELLGFVHFPTIDVRSPKLVRQTAKTKPAPSLVNNPSGQFLGSNSHLGYQRDVWLTPEQRVRHLHVVGASGTGKSSLLFNMIRRDIENGEGVAVLDPHGDLVDQILGIIPSERIDDVIVFDPSDEEFSVGFNILSAHSDLEKTLLASDLVSIFRRLSTAWGDQMGSVLNNAILAFLESSRGGTLADLRRFLLEPAFRERVLETVTDPDIVYYWRKGFAQLSGNKSVGPVLTRLDTFLSPKPIRYMVSQQVNRLDFANILDSGKIFLAKLSQGAIGNENSYLLGSLLMAKFQQTAMSRQRQQESLRRFFWLYLDEFHHFITPSMAEILSGARKYRLGLTLAHQELRQLQRDPEVASAVMANCYTRVCYRVGDSDARALESGFSFFEARDLQNLGTGEAICRIERSDFDFNLSVPRPEMPTDEEAIERRCQVVTASRDKYATPRAVVEADLRARAEATETPKPAGRAGIATKPTPAEPPSHSQKSELPPEASTPVLKPKAVTPAAPRTAAPAELGKGGKQHQAVQSRIKEGAIALGFRVVIEKPVLDGSGLVDLVLDREETSIACEVTVTNTIDYEVGNVARCIKAGFHQIVVVGVTDDKLQKLKAAVRNSLGPESAIKVQFFLPDEFLDYLRQLPAPAPTGPKTKTVRGYNVKSVYGDASPEEAKEKEDQMIRLIADMMRKKKP
jgi:hypothetical protein